LLSSSTKGLSCEHPFSLQGLFCGEIGLFCGDVRLFFKHIGSFAER
jgi:hypothetical protein